MKGLCQDMCPKREREERMAHLLETDDPWDQVPSTIKSNNKSLIQQWNTTKKGQAKISNAQLQMVKEYTRSAADKQICVEDVRPFVVLKRTVEYLMER